MFNANCNCIITIEIYVCLTSGRQEKVFVNQFEPHHYFCLELTHFSSKKEMTSICIHVSQYSVLNGLHAFEHHSETIHCTLHHIYQYHGQKKICKYIRLESLSIYS